MGKLKDSKWFYVALSIVLAVALWAYVQVEYDPEKSTTFHNLPINLVGEDVLESRGLMVSSVTPDGVSITFHGATSALRTLTQNRPTLSVDLSRISAAGEYSIVPSIGYPSNVPQSSLTNNRSVSNVTVTVVALSSREIPVEGTFVGEVAEGYQAGELSITPASITISGEEEKVRQVARAVVEVGGEKLTSTFTGELPITLLDSTGNQISSGEVRCSTTSALVVLPVVVVKEVPLRVDLIYGGGATKEYVKCEIEPKTISVAGEAEDIENLDEIWLGEINLSKVFTTTTETFPINLSKELTNASGISQAEVTVTIQGLEMTTLSVDNIDLINVSSGYRATVVTKSLDVQVRGPEGKLEDISPAQVRVIGDLTDIVSATGRYTVPAKVYWDGPDDIGIVGEYHIIVQVTR